MGKALYRAYRSTSFDEVLGQEHVTTSLKNALKKKQINHAYLLTGPRGVGKTSVARILAHAVNGLDYTRDQTHIDIIEIDAASNRRIDEIRDLRERVMVAPALTKYKVYIIDEVHMLTREAFNALLKTLEEPPEHVIFILATTEFHKLPDTVASRCLRFSFKPIDNETALAHLRHIAKKENLNIDDGALDLIARHGGGSFRDSISLLDQIRNIGAEVSLTDVQNMLGVAPEDKIYSLLKNLEHGTPKELLDNLTDLYSRGAEASEIAKQLSAVFRNDLIAGKCDLGESTTITLLSKLLEIPAARDSEAQLELVLLEVLLEKSPLDNSPQTKDIEITNNTKSQPKTATGSSLPVSEKLANFSELAYSPISLTEKTITPAPDNQPMQSVLLALKAKNNTLYSITRMASTAFTGDKLILTFKFAFHHKQANEIKNKTLIQDIVSKEFPNIKSVEMLLASKDPNSAAVKFGTPKPALDSTVDSITNIFGGGEVLES